MCVARKGRDPAELKRVSFFTQTGRSTKSSTKQALCAWGCLAADPEPPTPKLRWALLICPTTPGKSLSLPGGQRGGRAGGCPELSQPASPDTARMVMRERQRGAAWTFLRKVLLPVARESSKEIKEITLLPARPKTRVSVSRACPGLRSFQKGWQGQNQTEIRPLSDSAHWIFNSPVNRCLQKEGFHSKTD